jgi:hypothetical protein
MNEQLKSFLDSLDGMFGQAEVMEAANRIIDNETERYHSAALEILNRRINLTDDQKAVIKSVESRLDRMDTETDFNDSFLLEEIDKSIEFLGVARDVELIRMISLGKFKQKYLLSESRRTQFVIPAIVDIANEPLLDFSESDKKNWHYWNKLRSFLEEKYVKPGEEEKGLELIAQIDKQTDKVLRYLKDPRKPFPADPLKKDFTVNGLVIGHVQSGKTANFMGLISKSVSIGYRFIIILSGTKNDLRNQTQNRLDQELSGIDRYGLKVRGVKFADWESKTALDDILEWSIEGVQTPAPAKAESFWRYNTMTTATDFEYNAGTPNFTDVFENHNVVVVVVKKNAKKPSKGDPEFEFKGVLGKLNQWIMERRDKTFLPPTLIIDDEADQATVDSKAKKEELEKQGYLPSTINGCIQTLVRDIYGYKLSPNATTRQLSFVGYTATPFANVFMSSTHDCLYPKDFILALNAPLNYFGMEKYYGKITRNLFIKNCDEGEADKERKHLINQKLISPPLPLHALIPERLINAFHDFLFYCAIKDFRKLKQEKTMMVHSSQSIDEQETIYKRLLRYKKALETSIQSLGCQAEYWPLVKKHFEDYTKVASDIKANLQLSHSWPAWSDDELKNKLIDILAKVQFKLVNGPNDSLDYTREQLDYVVAVGGNILSRGITLEGLAVSFYLRKANNYDSLLQMARWFGYRDGYEDLIRVYTAKNISDAFEHLLQVEADLREEIKSYERDGMKPSDFAPAVRAHTKMRPSGRMGVASRQTSYSGQVIQTFIMDVSERAILSNNTLAHTFVKELANNYSMQRTGSKVQFKNVEIQWVIDYFLKDYIYGYQNNRGIRKEEVLDYIEKMKGLGKMNKIDVLLSGPQTMKSGATAENMANGQIIINPVVRKNARSKDPNNEIIFFGVVSDPTDFNNIGSNPVLALYFIDKINSVDDEKGFDSPQKVNPVAFAMGFPNFGDSEYWRQEIFKKNI